MRHVASFKFCFLMIDIKQTHTKKLILYNSFFTTIADSEDVTHLTWYLPKLSILRCDRSLFVWNLEGRISGFLQRSLEKIRDLWNFLQGNLRLLLCMKVSREFAFTLKWDSSSVKRIVLHRFMGQSRGFLNHAKLIFQRTETYKAQEVGFIANSSPPYLTQ